MAKVTGFILLALALLALAGLQGCSGAHAGESVVEHVRAETEANDPDVRWNPAHLGIQTLDVPKYADIEPFQTVARMGAIEGYPCSECHSEPLAVLNARRKNDEPLSHWQIKMLHASETFMSCQTCHGEGDMDELRMLGGKPVGFDASYQVCGQCHGKQEKEWAGGGHGKRLGGWAPPRVVQTCTGCHNPHRPAFESRWPAQLTKGMR